MWKNLNNMDLIGYILSDNIVLNERKYYNL